MYLQNDYTQITDIFNQSKSSLSKKISKENLKEDYLIYKSNFKKYSVVTRKFFLSRIINDDIELELRNLYEYGYGLKAISKALNISYTNTRSLLKHLKIDIRQGRNVVTDELKKCRSINAIKQRNEKTGFFSEDIRSNLKIINKTHKGVQGWYFNISMNKWVWLRSTYEFIFAKWLDRTGHLWDVELKKYKIGNETYRPDFFILDENMNIIKIIETKGYIQNNSHKPKLLEELIKTDVILLHLDSKKIKTYTEYNKSYQTILKEWKIIRKQNENKKNNS
jgi:hypothetical protein